MPIRETGEGDLHLEDYPGDDFEKGGSSHRKKPPKHHLPLFLNNLQKHPLVLNRGRRGSKL